MFLFWRKSTLLRRSIRTADNFIDEERICVFVSSYSTYSYSHHIQITVLVVYYVFIFFLNCDEYLVKCQWVAFDRSIVLIQINGIYVHGIMFLGFFLYEFIPWKIVRTIYHYFHGMIGCNSLQCRWSGEDIGFRITVVKFTTITFRGAKTLYNFLSSYNEHSAE